MSIPLKQRVQILEFLLEREQRRSRILSSIKPPKYVPGEGIQDIKDYWDKRVLAAL